jgi:hypothetical protein
LYAEEKVGAFEREGVVAEQEMEAVVEEVAKEAAEVVVRVIYAITAKEAVSKEAALGDLRKNHH